MNRKNAYNLHTYFMFLVGIFCMCVCLSSPWAFDPTICPDDDGLPPGPDCPGCRTGSPGINVSITEDTKAGDPEDEYADQDQEDSKDKDILEDLMVKYKSDSSDIGGGGQTVTDSSDLSKQVQAFSDAPLTGQVDAKGDTPTIGGKPAPGEVSDLEVGAKDREAREREEEAEKARIKREQELAYNEQWQNTLERIDDLNRKREKINLEKLKLQQEIGEQLVEGVEKHLERLERMTKDFEAEKRALERELKEQFAQNQRDDCANAITYDRTRNELICDCGGYVFDPLQRCCVRGKGPPEPDTVNREPDKSGLSDVTVNISPTTLTVWDFSVEDLDRVDILLNGSVVRNNLTIRKAKLHITLYLQPGNNTLSVRALNIGDPEMQKKLNLSPYNSAAIEIQGVVTGKRTQSWELKAGQIGTMQISYQP